MKKTVNKIVLFVLGRALEIVSRLDDDVRREVATRPENYRSTKLQRTLKEAKVPADDFKTLAQRTLDDGGMLLNPIDIPLDDAIAIIRKAYE